MSRDRDRGPVPAEMTGGVIGSDPLVSQRTSTFVFLWGVFWLFHSSITLRREATTLQVMAAVAAFLVVIKPISAIRFAGLLIVTSAYLWMSMPFVPNHVLLAFFITVTALAGISSGVLKGNRSLTEVMPDTVNSLIRCEILIMYFYVVLHKINTDYFNPNVSCAVIMFRESRVFNRALPGAIESSSILAVLLLEALIPILLLVRRTRVLGVGIGLVFHFLLSFHPNDHVASYSAMLTAIFVLFLPEDFVADLRCVVKSRWVSRLAGLSLIAVLTWTGMRIRSVPPGWPMLEKLAQDLIAGPRRIWFVLGAAAIAIYGVTLFGRLAEEWRRLAYASESYEYRDSRPAVSWLLIFPAIVFSNGLCPYLGLKTESSFAMFSNLRTEGGMTNHLFMPIRFRLAHYQEDLVEIVDSSSSELRRFRETGNGLTYFELRRSVAGTRDPDFTVTYIRNGHRFTAERRTDPGAEVFLPNPALLNKLLWFAPVQLDPGPQICRH